MAAFSSPSPLDDFGDGVEGEDDERFVVELNDNVAVRFGCEDDPDAPGALNVLDERPSSFGMLSFVMVRSFTSTESSRSSPRWPSMFLPGGVGPRNRS